MDFDYTLNVAEALRSMRKRGAFLTVRDNEGSLNTMTIGWGNIGYQWGRPIFTVLVRQSRHTYSLLENAADFTVSIPFNDQMNTALEYCGNNSGKDLDKFKECSLRVLESKSVQSPGINGCEMIYECRIVYKHRVDLEVLVDEIKTEWYKKTDKTWYDPDDIHTIYYGEIVAC